MLRAPYVKAIMGVRCSQHVLQLGIDQAFLFQLLLQLLPLILCRSLLACSLRPGFCHLSAEDPQHKQASASIRTPQNQSLNKHSHQAKWPGLSTVAVYLRLPPL